MFRIQRLNLRWVTVALVFMLTAAVTAQADTPQLPLTMLGFQRDEAQIEWMLTVSNAGTVDARNVVITDTLPDGLRVDTVQINTGSANVNEQTVTVILPVLQPGAIVQFSILTTQIATLAPSNTACVTADKLAETLCVPALVVQALPNTMLSTRLLSA